MKMKFNKYFALIIPALVVPSATAVDVDTVCDDDPSYNFTLPNQKDRGCSWITKNSNKIINRRKRYCSATQLGQEIRDSCPQSCGYCTDPPSSNILCSEKCFKDSRFITNVCDNDLICSSCTKARSLLETCKFLWKARRCGFGSEIYGGLDCSGVRSIHQCYKQKTGTRETLMMPLKSKPFASKPRYQWIRSRQPYEPLQGDTTMIAGVLFTLSDSTLKMSALFPPLYKWEATRAYLHIRGQSSSQEYEMECDIVPYM